METENLIPKVEKIFENLVTWGAVLIAVIIT